MNDRKEQKNILDQAASEREKRRSGRECSSCFEADSFYDSFFRANHIVTLIFDPETTEILDANNAACAFYGYSLAEFKKLKVFDLNISDNSAVKENVSSALKGTKNEFQIEHRLADGTIKTIRAYSGRASVFGKECIYSCIFDVTGHVETQRRLTESEEKFKKLYIDAPVPYQSLDVHGHFIDINNTFCKVMKYSREDLLGRNFREIIHPEWMPFFEDIFFRFKSSGEISGVELKLLRKDGTYLMVALTGKAERNFDGSSREMHCVFRDITREREEILGIRESEHRFRSLFEGLGMIAVQGHDENRNIIFWNKSSELLFGYSAEEAMGKKIEEVVLAPKNRSQFIKSMDAWVAGGKPIPAGEFELMDREGNKVHVYYSHIMQKNRSGRIEVYSINVDLSAIKEANIELLKAKNEAERANEAKSIFLANMSHELRTPLNGIIGMHGLLRTTGLDTEQSRYIDGAVTAAKRLTDLLGDVLDLSKIEAGKTVLIEKELDFHKIVRHSIDLFSPACIQKDLEVRTRIDDNLPHFVCGDHIRLSQIVTNLIGNSVKFTESGFIGYDVSCLSERNGVANILFIICDSGIGISDEELKDIFDIFIQGEDSYVRRFQGAGLGLSIVKKLVKMMNGSLTIDSVKGQGTCVYFSVPLKVASNPADEFESVKRKIDVNDKKYSRILLVEDEAINRLAMKKMLEKQGASVTCAANGRDALDELLQDDFDVVLMDIQMPVLDGIETTKQIRSGAVGDSKKDIHIIALTAYAMSGDREAFLEAGMDDYLTKPIEIERLIKILNL